MFMKLEKFEYVDTDILGFIDFWSGKYWDPLEKDYYEKYINESPSETRTWKLFAWKNGNENIAEKKRQSITKAYISELHKLPLLKSLDDAKEYWKQLSGGPIWNIFWLHCINPDLFPIFDQHTYRAMARITGRDSSEMPLKPLDIYAVYFDEYIEFTKQFGNDDPRKIDKALFSYGRFLKSPFNNDSISDT